MLTMQRHLNYSESLLIPIFRRCTIRIFISTQFSTGDQKEQKILISLGCATENGHTFYAEVYDYDSELVKSIPWSKDHLTTKVGQAILPDTEVRGSSNQVGVALAWWFGQLEEQVEIWSDAPAVDWVLFCELFGGVQFVPKNVLYPPFDLNTLFKLKGTPPDANREEYALLTGGQLTNVLWMAQVMAACYDKLMAVPA